MWVDFEMRRVELGGDGWIWVEMGSRLSNNPKTTSSKRQHNCLQLHEMSLSRIRQKRKTSFHIYQEKDDD